MFITELGKKFDTGKIGVIAENKENHISFTVNVVLNSYTDTSDKVKKKFNLDLSIALDSWQVVLIGSLTSNLGGVNETFCKKCDRKERFELMHISEYYIAHGKCRNCTEYVSKQLIIDSIFNDVDNLIDNHTDRREVLFSPVLTNSLNYYSERKFICINTSKIGISLKKQGYLLRKRFIVTLT